jgi:hypothetical protein
LPYVIESRLVDENLFYNFDLRLANVQREGMDTPLTDEVIVGIVEEKSEFKSISETTRTDTHTMVLAYGEAINSREGIQGFDLFQFRLYHNEHVTRPASYGGLSGSAIWKVGQSPRMNDRIVMGIAFHESDVDEKGERLIVCHGPACIYNKLVEAIRDKFSREFKEPSGI